jgi:hypothetical protein
MAKLTALVLSCAVAMGVASVAGLRAGLTRERSKLEHNKNLVRKLRAAVWNESGRDKAAKAMRELFTPNFVVHDWTGDQHLGHDALIARWEFEHSAFAGLIEHAEAIVAEGDLVVDRFVSTATQVRDLPQFPSTRPGFEIVVDH